MHFVEAAEVYAVGNQKRALSESSLAANPRIGKKWKGPEPFKLPLAPKIVVPEKEGQVRKRQPPRKLEVRLPKPDVWARLKEVDAGISLAQWLALDKNAYADVRDGLKYLHGRQAPKKTLAEPMEINALQAQSFGRGGACDETSAESEEEGDMAGAVAGDTDWDSTWLEASERGEEELLAESQEEAYDSEDTEYNYPYDLQEMKKSIPLRGPVVINGQVVQAVFDSGASVSIISKSLAQRLRLVSNGDQLAVSTMDEQSDQACEIVGNVPIRVAGKLRPEHMCIEATTYRDLCLLGMTWFRAYGIIPKMEQSILVIPTKKAMYLCHLHLTLNPPRNFNFIKGQMGWLTGVQFQQNRKKAK